MLISREKENKNVECQKLSDRTFAFSAHEILILAGGKTRFADFWFSLDFHRFKLNFTNTSFQGLKDWNIAYKKYQNPKS